MNENNLDLKACRLCLETNCRLYDINASTIAYILDEFTSSTASAMKGVPPYVCGLCCTQLLKASTFRSRCMAIQNYLHELSLIEPLTMDIIKNTDRSKIKNQLKNSDMVIMYCGDDAEDDKQDVLKSENYNDCDDFLYDVECNGNDNSLHHFGNDNYNLINPPVFVKLDENIKSEPLNLDVISKSVKKEKDTTIKIKKDQISKDKLKEALQQLISDTKDEHKIALYSFILEKYVLKMKKVNLMDPFDLDDEVLEKNVPNDKDLENMDPNERIFYEFVIEKYKKGTIEKKKVLDVLQLQCKLPVRKQTNKKIQEDKDVHFPELANFEVMLLSKKEQLAEQQERKVKYAKSPYKCEVCFRGFSMESTYRRHLPVHDPRSGAAMCEICKYRFPTRRKLMTHYLLHKWKFICKICGATKKKRGDARIHNAVHEGKTTYVCEHCGKIFSRYKSRVEHIRIHHGATRCDICYKGLSNHHAVNQHKGKAHRQVFVCDVCNVTFNKKSALTNHLDSLVTTCVDVRPCSACGENLKTEAELESHIMSVHPYKRPPLTTPEGQCCPCGHKEAAFDDASGENITAESNPDINVAANTDNINQDCNCPCKFVVRRRKRRNRAELERGHSSKSNMSEEDEKYEYPPKKHKFMCEFCSKDKFQSFIHLQMHQRVHTGEKPHVCPVCSKRFRVKTALQNHMTVHTGERSYECDFCDKVFKSASSRHRHQRFIHTGLRPHKCMICEKRFQTASCVKLHVQTVHNKIPYVRKNKRK